jgi:hypothetical protein
MPLMKVAVFWLAADADRCLLLFRILINDEMERGKHAGVIRTLTFVELLVLTPQEIP